MASAFAPEPTRLWRLHACGALTRAAAVAYAEGITPQHVSDATMCNALTRLEVHWQRAKHWITSPDPAYARKTKACRLLRLAARHPDWVLGFADAVGWSRLAQPNMSSWTPAAGVLQFVEQTVVP